MAQLQKVQSVKVWTSSDGKAHDNKDQAAKHQSVLNLRAWFAATVDEATAVQLVEAITGDVDGFREIVGPILVKPRAARGSKKAETEAAQAAADEEGEIKPEPVTSIGAKRRAA